MSRMFCTLKEAAETLHASEDQIQALLEQGLLHEFREGPHRLLKEADVGALVSVGAGGTADRRQKMDDRRQTTDGGRQRTRPLSILRTPSSVVRPSRPVLRDEPRRSVRQWFWMGLIQDRPLVIALLSGLVLLGLSALAAGLCLLAQTWR